MNMLEDDSDVLIFGYFNLSDLSWISEMSSTWYPTTPATVSIT